VKNNVPVICTLVFPVKKKNWAKWVILGKKKRGFGKGRYNGFGGKVRSNETIIETAIRELKEESGLQVYPEDLKYMGTLHFISCDNFDTTVYIFTCEKYDGEPTESEEMTVALLDVNNLPFNHMWPDDRIWLPFVLKDEKEVSGYFSFKGEDEISHFSLSVGRLNE